MQTALRLLKSGNSNYLVTEAVQKVAESYKCKPIEGMLSHQLKQFRIDGEKTIIQNPSEAQRKEHEKCNFETHEVYAIDVIISSGEGVVSPACTFYYGLSLIIILEGSRKRHKSSDLQEDWRELSVEAESIKIILCWSKLFQILCLFVHNFCPWWKKCAWGWEFAGKTLTST